MRVNFAGGGENAFLSAALQRRSPSSKRRNATARAEASERLAAKSSPA
jgi:hypothetical protein